MPLASDCHHIFGSASLLRLTLSYTLAYHKQGSTIFSQRELYHACSGQLQAGQNDSICNVAGVHHTRAGHTFCGTTATDGDSTATAWTDRANIDAVSPQFLRQMTAVQSGL